MTTSDPRTRTSCPGCYDDGCAVCEPDPKWDGMPSQYHAQKAYKGGASDKQIAYLVSLGMDKAEAEKLDKTEASRAIDRLRETAPAPLMSEKQESFLRTLLARKQPEADADAIINGINGLSAQGGQPRGAASTMIDILKARPDAKAKDAVKLEDGIYQIDGQVRKVYHTVHGRNEQVAKVWDENSRSFEYVGKRGLRGLTPAHKMTLAQAKEFGAIYGICCNCSATLTDERSIEEGIGPVCAKRFA